MSATATREVVTTPESIRDYLVLHYNIAEQTVEAALARDENLGELNRAIALHTLVFTTGDAIAEREGWKNQDEDEDEDEDEDDEEEEEGEEGADEEDDEDDEDDEED